MRKDNHKEVERRRRGNINDGINELSRLLPSSNGDKAKGAVLQRAVAYMSQLKENEARSIEKWTIEKMMMDKSMEEVHVRLEVCEQKLTDAERRATEERKKRMELEVELIDLRRGRGGGERGGGTETDRPYKRQRLE
jgi:transcriptional regulator CBF1